MIMTARVKSLGEKLLRIPKIHLLEGTIDFITKELTPPVPVLHSKLIATLKIQLSGNLLDRHKVLLVVNNSL